MIATSHDSGSEPAPPKKKRPVTDAMRAASKANSAMSTGPRSIRGRAAVIVNALKHGQTCKKLIFLEGEDPEMFWKEVAAWVRDRGAVTGDEIALIEAAVYSRWTRRRAQNAQAWAVKEAVDGIKNGFADRKEAEVQALIPQLATAPRVTINELMNSSCGCKFLIKQFILIGKSLTIFPSLAANQRSYFLQLSGHRPEDLFVNREVWEINREYLGALSGVGGFTAEGAADAFVYERDENMSAIEFQDRLEPMVEALPSQADGLARLQERVRKAIKRLRERLELVRYREKAAKEAAVGKAQADISPDGDKRARYMAMSDRTMISALRTVVALKKDRKASDDDDREPDDGAPEDEPPPEPAPVPEPEPERSETPAASEPAESDQAHRNGASAPVAESPDPGAALALNEEKQNKAVAMQVFGEPGRNDASAPPPAAGSASPALLSAADREASRAVYRRMLEAWEAKLEESSETEASGSPDS